MKPDESWSVDIPIERWVLAWVISLAVGGALAAMLGGSLYLVYLFMEMVIKAVVAGLGCG